MAYNGLRGEWVFEYEVQELLTACNSKIDHHSNRIDYWESERDNSLASLKEHGVEFREYDVTGGQRLEVIADPSLAARFRESKNKVEQHKKSRLEFSRFARAFERASQSNPSIKYELSIEDVEYFGL